MSTDGPAAVWVDMVWRLVADDRDPLCHTVPVRVACRYNSEDPYAVHVAFDTEDGPLWWTFARELLVAGLDEPTGYGDVRVWPWPGRGEVVALAMSSPTGSSLFEVPRSVLVRFLRRTYVVVARGMEAGRIDLDATVSRLLAGR